TICVESCSFEGVKALEEEGFYCRDASELLIYLIVGSLALTLLLLACVVYVFVKLKRQRKVRQAIVDLYTNMSKPEPGAHMKEPNMGRLVIINWNELKLDRYKPLGSGAFGVVYRGWWRVPESEGMEKNMRISVAIKSFRSATKQIVGPCGKYDELLQEAKVMASVEHEHCLRIIGLCVNKDAPCLISKLLPLGSLDSWINSNRKSITSAHMLTWAKQIAAGMEYLGQHKIIHRDLAARNVLLLKEKHVQISDFGLAKILEHVQGDSVVIKTGQVPIRWLALETIQSGQYSFKTDVWSYGITLWEIFTFVEKPYGNIATDEIKSFLLSGKRLHKPDICSIDVFLLMNQCWMAEPNKRPNFTECKERFGFFLGYASHYLPLGESRVAYRRNVSGISTASPYSLVNPHDYLTPSVKGSSFSSSKDGLTPQSPSAKSFLSQSSYSEYGCDLSRKELLPVARKCKKAKSKFARFLDMIRGSSYSRRCEIDAAEFENTTQPMLMYVRPPVLLRNNSYMPSESCSSTGTAETDYLSSTPSSASTKLSGNLMSWSNLQTPMEDVAEESEDYLKPSEHRESETSI
ncbi:Receptor tyrosine-protein kinase erbB-2, partial [Cichlidogyrus casuarinus]